jgi:hypothetical protein
LYIDVIKVVYMALIIILQTTGEQAWLQLEAMLAVGLAAAVVLLQVA